ncbi:MLP-like protein 43 [Mucuna pruriens]|uniref:MLP-like protein 43 n=1 Tax=Mucuna pruriens TaxID=157652 RepID=A0A371I962_MUCPR|nr:MLP-like protein 43 [Mucuna pruriens]
MSLVGKISTEIGVHATAAKWFNLFAKQLHHVQNLTDRVHGTKLHRGNDWHHSETIKHWTYTIDGKVTTCQESIESIDEQNKTIFYKLFSGDIDHQYKDFKLIFQAIDNNRGGAIIKWTVEYEKIAEDVDPPYGYIEYVHKCTSDIDGHLLKA